MIRRVIAFSAHNKFLVLILFAALVVGAVMALRTIPLDAIPDLSDTQVIVYSRWDRSPDIVEDQVTYPIIASLLGAPKVQAVRGFSDFGFSYVYVIFEDGTDLYWARSRVLEYLSKIQTRLPAGVKTELGPDGSSVGWVYQYALVDETGRHTLDELRSVQDWFLRYQVQSVPGVAEVAGLGGMTKQYQVIVDPSALASHGIGIAEVVRAVRAGNAEVGGRLVEMSGHEYMVRGRGYVKSAADLEDIVLRASSGTPVRIRDVGHVEIGPDMRRGVADLDGRGDTVGGIVVMRSGHNALEVIRAVKAKLAAVATSLPEGVRIVETYDRSDLILRAIHTLKEKLTEEMLIVSLVILVFLWHVPSSIVPIVTIPVSVLLSFIPMRMMGIEANLMSLSGIAISIGVLVDGAIVEVENAYKKLQLWNDGGRKGDFHKVRLEALQEVGPSVFFSLLVIAIAFLPVFTLTGEEGRLFRPLAITKNLSMAIAAVLALTLDPALRMLFARMDPIPLRPRWLGKIADVLFVGTYYAEERHPISRAIFRVYDPVCRFVLRHPRKVIVFALLLVLSTVPVYLRLGREFMPPLDEGSILYMPTTLPGISVTEAQRLLQVQDRLLATFPEVLRVHGKAGRADTATDPAPFSMMETTVLLKPHDQWRAKETWWSERLGFLGPVLRPFWPDRITHDELVAEMDRALQIPGQMNAWTMPIRNRIDMLATGIRTPVGIKIFGSDLNVIQKVGEEVERAVKTVPGTRSVLAERVAGGYFLDVDLRRDALARYGISIEDAQAVVMAAVGGEEVTTTIEGRERYSVNVRFPRELRQDPESIARILVTVPGGGAGAAGSGMGMGGGAPAPAAGIRPLQVPLGQIADIRLAEGPSMIRDENGLLAGYVFVDFDTSKRDIGGFVDDAKAAVAAAVEVPTGVTLVWSGQYENMLRVRARLRIVVPVTIALIALLLYMNTKSGVKTAIVLLAVPFSVIGAVWLLFLLGYNLSIAAWVGMIALMGLDAETGVFMLLFLDLAHDDAIREGKMRNRADLEESILHGAVKRARPKMMTVAALFMGLLPILWSTGAGADVMKRIAAPMVGGLVTSFALELLVYPAIYLLWKERELPATT